MYEQKKPLTGLFAEVIEEIVHLFQNEIRLVKAELNEKLGRLRSGGVMIAVGAVLALGALFLLLQDIVTWLAVAGLAPQWGYLIVGVVLAVAGGALLMKGARDMKPENFVPTRSIEEAKADFAAVKERMS